MFGKTIATTESFDRCSCKSLTIDEIGGSITRISMGCPITDKRQHHISVAAEDVIDGSFVYTATERVVDADDQLHLVYSNRFSAEWHLGSVACPAMCDTCPVAFMTDAEVAQRYPPQS